MTVKTPGDGCLRKTWIKRASILLAFVVFSAIVLPVPAAATHAHSVVVFTDKKTYMGWWVDPVKNGVGYTYIGVDDAPLDVYVYTMVLSEKGTIIKGEESQLNGYVADYKRLAPGKSLTAHHNEFFGETVFGNKTLTFTDDGSLSGDIAGDGVYVAKVTLDKSKGATLVADHMVMNVTVSYPGMESNTQQILISQFYCMNGKQSGAGHAQHTSQTGTSANCAVCHRGYEHWFENKSKTFRDDQLDVHVFKANAPDVPLANQTTPFDSNRWNWSDDGGNNDNATFEQQVSGSKYCAFCHEVAGSATYDYGGGDRTNMADRPSCNNSNCHANTKINNTAVPAWNPAAMPGVASTITRAAYNITKAEKHAHDTTGVDTVPCASCHRTTHSLELPNRTSTDYTDLANRCLSCHTLFNKHNNSVSCIKCHTNDTHNIRFLQQDLSYNWSTTNVVTCDNCHTNTTFSGSLGLNPPQVPYTNHSGDNDAGQKWGDYWTSDNQQAAVGGSNLIQTSTVVVSSQSAQYGTASPLSGAQTVDASYETLTEGTRPIAPVDSYAYVASTIANLGTVLNFSFMQIADSQNATLREGISGTIIIRPNATSASDTTTDTLSGILYDDSVSENPNTLSAVSTTDNVYTVDASKVMFLDKFNTSKIPSGATITGVTLHLEYGIEAGYAPATASVRWSRQGGALNSTGITPDETVLTSGWSGDTTYDLYAQGIDTVSEIADLNIDFTSSDTGGADAIHFDYVWLEVTYTGGSPSYYEMNIEANIDVPYADTNYLEIRYYRNNNDTYDLYVYNGSKWNDRGDLTATTMSVLNYTLTSEEYNNGGVENANGSVGIRFVDKNQTPNGTLQGNLYIDYIRVHYLLGNTSHQEINLNHNFTGIPKYAAQETSEYTLAVKGYATAGENLDIYAYDYTASSYQLVKVRAFPTTNDWVNWSIPYTAISSSGEASIQFRDANRSRYDNVVDNFYLDYVGIKADNYKYLPCFYCHALLANHKKRALGNIEWVQTGATEQNPKNSTNLSGNWCANCHYNGSAASGKYKYNGSAWSPVPPLVTYNNINPSNPNYGSWYNHSGDVSSNYTDAKCKECHGTANTNTTKDFPHAVEVGSSGGANCTNCHNTGGSAGTGRLVNFTAMNDTSAIHKNLNKDRTTSLPFGNKRCWACHGNGSEPGSGHPSNYKTPYKCVDCHLSGTGQNFNYTPSNTLLNVTQHYWNGTNISTTPASCYACHNRSEMMLGGFDPDGAAGVYSGANGGNNSTSHYGKKRSDLGGYAQDTSGYCNYCHNTTTNNATFFVSDFNNTIYNHSARSTTPLCTNCHSTGRLHNSTLAKPASNDSYCSTCHGTGGTVATNNKTRHKALNCTECHANNTVGTLAGKDIHAVKYLTQSNSFATSNSSAVNCVTCHQTTGVDSSLGSFSAFKITTPMSHSDNASNGSVWDGYWTNTTPQTACVYCHNSTLHNVTPLGRILQWNQNYNLYGSIGSNVSCSDCHYRGDSNYTQMNSTFVAAGLRTPPEITNDTNWKGNSSNYYNHSLDAYDDSACKNCHGSLLSASANMSEFMHNVAVGVAGGANCTNCHNVGGTAGTGKLVNFTAMNDTGGIHRNLNSGASTSLPIENKKCWACHGNGSEPASGHPSNYKTPYKCVDCHVPGAGQNMNFTPASILNVTQHYWNGTKVATSNATSCYICHNRTEMMVGSYDPDGGGTGVYSGANGGNLSVSHYGKKRGDMAAMDNNTYCKYCHDNQSSAFPFINNSNKTIANHSINYPSTNPACANCHEAGRIHNSTLYKPAFALPNSTYCLICHGSGGSATLNNFERHNSTSSTALNCTQCHLNSTESIHPARYLQQGGSTWDTAKANAVNCTTCHQGSGLSGFNTAPITPKPMNHSTNSYSGALWNNTQPAYWTNTSQQSSCEYCHGKIALHNNSGLGNITRVKGNNAVRQALDNSTWCANCHYSGATNYKGTLFSPEPPEVTNASGKVPTKARDNTNFYNHSQDMATGYNDSKCKTCHDNALDAGATSLNFSHNVAAGGGGANCTSCHYTGAGVQNINITAISDANAIHKDLNKDATASDNGYNGSKKCWACHSNGQEPSGHPSRYKNPYNCTDCHVQGAGQNFNYTPNNTILNVTQHFWNGNSIRTPNATSCYACHNTTGMIIAANDPDGASSNINSGANGGNDSVSHYGKKRGDMAAQQNTTPYCDSCHNGSSAFPFINSANRTISNHSLNYPATNPACKECHSGGRIHNSTLYKTTLGSANSTYCLSCHGNNGTGGTNYSGAVTGIKERHNNTGTACTQCHLNASGSIHPARYLQQDNNWDTTKTNAVNCTTCHQGSGLGGSFGSAPKVPSLNHSTNAYSGAMWNGSQSGFWTNTSQQSSCDYCHNKAALHNLSGLGNITKIKGSNSMRQSFAGGYWCANCHYAGATNYSGDKFDPRPPEVLNTSGLVPSTARDGTQFYNHSGDLSSWDDAKCKTCHNNNLGASATSLNFTHSLGSGGGGANCTSCHGLSGTLSDGKRINQTAINSSLSLHKDLNKNAAASDANYSESKKCWACHGNGDEPSGHPTRYKTPYNCVDCHVPGAGQNFNYIPNNTILNVTQHYWNGTSINTSGATSCYVCHNKSEMMIGNILDPDGASANINGGANGGNLSVSHYGKKRSDMAGMANTTYCNYCHSNQSSVFPFANNSNKTIANHSMNYAATNPACRECHEGGRIHNGTLYKPAFILSNSTYCLNCHGNNGTGGTNYTAAVTGYKEKHNNSLCTDCHLNSTESIHPVRYLRQNSTWGSTNGTAVNCTSCHQGSGMSGFATAPLVQTPIWHSNNSYSGALWNGTQPRYWDNTSQQSSCDYCHGKQALHNLSGLGKSALVQANNSKNQSLTGGYWCVNCHYKGKSSGDVPSGKYNYTGNLFSPVPPEIFNLTSLVPANASDGTPFQNHTKNGIGSDWSDDRCQDCHGKDLQAGTTSATFLHKLNKSKPDAGGPDCLKCHPSTANEPDGPPTDRRINKTAFTNYSVHRDLNKNAANATILSDNRSKACWACHGNGNEPTGFHPTEFITPKPCEYCHVSNNFNATLIYRHYPGAVFAGSRVYDNSDTNRTCIACHNNSVIASLNLTYGTYGAVKLKNATAAHYAVNRTLGESLEASGGVTAALPNTRNTTGSYGCNQCHAVGGLDGTYGPNYGSSRGVLFNHNRMGSSGFPCQKSCHNSVPSFNITLHSANLGINIGTSGCYSSGCHTAPSTGGRRKR